MEGSRKGRHHRRVFKRPILRHQKHFESRAQKKTCSQRAPSAVHKREAESHQCEPIQPLCMRILTINKMSDLVSPPYLKQAPNNETLPKAQRTRGLSSYHKLHTNLDQISYFRISNRFQLQNLKHLD